MDGRDSHDIGNQNVVLKFMETLKFWLNGDKYHTLCMNISVRICAILKRNSPNTHRTPKVFFFVVYLITYHVTRCTGGCRLSIRSSVRGR
jgi:hypothetical protein